MKLKLVVRQELEKIKDWRRDLKSKLIDGLLVFALIFLSMIVLSLLVVPFAMLLGKPGLLIYALVLLAVSIICLDRGLIERESSDFFGLVWHCRWNILLDVCQIDRTDWCFGAG